MVVISGNSEGSWGKRVELLETVELGEVGLHGRGHARRGEQALRLGEQAVAGGQLACIRRIQQGVVGRRVPQEEGQTGGESVVIEDHAGGILRVGGAQLHPVDEVWRLQQAGETVLESAEEISKHGLRVPGDGPVAPELFVRQRSPPDATPGALQKLARTHIVCRRGRRAASERRASARVREHLLRDGE